MGSDGRRLVGAADRIDEETGGLTGLFDLGTFAQILAPLRALAEERPDIASALEAGRTMVSEAAAWARSTVDAGPPGISPGTHPPTARLRPEPWTGLCSRMFRPLRSRSCCRSHRRRRFAANEIVFHRDDPGDAFHHLIAKGRFSIRVMTPLGQVATIALRGPGDSFGEMALLSEDARRSATVTAIEEAETFAVTRGDFEQRLRNPGVNDLLLRFLQNEVRLLNERLLEALFVRWSGASCAV